MGIGGLDKIIMITIVKRRYISTDASVIRTIAIAKGLGEQNVKTRIIFLMPIIGADNKLPKIHNVSFVCPKNFHNRYLNIINGILKMLKMLRNDDVIILMSFLFPLPINGILQWLFWGCLLSITIACIVIFVNVLVDSKNMGYIAKRLINLLSKFIVKK